VDDHLEAVERMQIAMATMAGLMVSEGQGQLPLG
jgi:hypothetical protein